MAEWFIKSAPQVKSHFFINLLRETVKRENFDFWISYVKIETAEAQKRLGVTIKQNFWLSELRT